MQKNLSKAKLGLQDNLMLNSRISLGIGAHTHYYLECRDKNGNLKWTDEINNTVVTEGLNKLIDATFKTGLASPAWYIGLVGAKTTGYDPDDTLSSHGGWTENTHYGGGGRPAFDVSDNSISSGSLSNSANKAAFTFSGTSNPDTINGAFLCTASSGTSGTLYGEGDLSIPRSVADGDILTLTVTISITSA
jgi:hypothetical protein